MHMLYLGGSGTNTQRWLHAYRETRFVAVAGRIFARTEQQWDARRTHSFLLATLLPSSSCWSFQVGDGAYSPVCYWELAVYVVQITASLYICTSQDDKITSDALSLCQK